MRVIVLCLLAAVTLDQQHSVSSWECIVLCCCCCRDHQSLGGIETKKFASKWNVSLLLWNFHWLDTYPRHTARRRTRHAMLCRISSDSALLQFSALTMTNAASASLPLWPASAPLRPVCVAGSREQPGDGTVWTLELLAGASPPFLRFPSFSQSEAGMGRHKCCIRSIGFHNQFFPYDFCVSDPTSHLLTVGSTPV